MNILMIGDVVARPGRKVLIQQLAMVQQANQIDFTVVNIENAAGGFGVTANVLKEFESLDIDVYTSGNHIWDKREVLDFIDQTPTLLRPHNYPAGTPGSGWLEVMSKGAIKVGVMNIMGQVFMNPTLNSPFESAVEILKHRSEDLKVVLLDFHAEATSEKNAMGCFLDGNISAVVGTHTHVPTADERILPGGTAYISDLGMTGCYDSVIGSDKSLVLKRTIEKLPARFESATGPGSLCGVVVEVDEHSGKALGIRRIRAEYQNP